MCPRIFPVVFHSSSFLCHLHLYHTLQSLVLMDTLLGNAHGYQPFFFFLEALSTQRTDDNMKRREEYNSSNPAADLRQRDLTRRPRDGSGRPRATCNDCKQGVVWARMDGANTTPEAQKPVGLFSPNSAAHRLLLLCCEKFEKVCLLASLCVVCPFVLLYAFVCVFLPPLLDSIAADSMVIFFRLRCLFMFVSFSSLLMLINSPTRLPPWRSGGSGRDRCLREKKVLQRVRRRSCTGTLHVALPAPRQARPAHCEDLGVLQPHRLAAAPGLSAPASCILILTT